MIKIVLISLFLSTCLLAQVENISPKWAPFKFLIGKWEGTGTGKWGASKVTREYDYLMGGTYIIGKNESRYEKQENNPEDENHVNWDILSYDKNRKKYVLRQFHAEDITNTYAADSAEVSTGKYEFESEAIENFGTGWKAREVYIKINENEFIEIFYLASPGKEYAEFVRNTFKRIK